MPEALPLTFEGALGAPLSARLHLPPTSPRAFALFAHCFTCSKDVRAAVAIARRLAEHGVATLRFDFTGLGESGGDFADSTFTTNLGDLQAAYGMLERDFEAPSLIIGHSLGGAAVLAAAKDMPAAKAVVTIGAPADPDHVRHLIPDDPAVHEEGQAEVRIAGRPFTITKAFLDDLQAQDGAANAKGLRRALLVMHAPLDNTVGVDNARRIYDAARHPKSFISLDGADHLLSRQRDSRFAADMIAAWSERYLPEWTPPPHQHGEVVVEGGRSGFVTRITAGEHVITADEPTSVGGSDLGPTPYDLLLAGLGACTSMTLRMYADRKKWPLHGVRVDLDHRRIHAKDAADCEECEGLEGRVEIIEKEITLEGPLDDEQRARLLEIAERCPVNRTLTGQLLVKQRTPVEH